MKIVRPSRRPLLTWVLQASALACSSPSTTLGQRSVELIYGDDHRLDLYAVESELSSHLARASSVALLREQSLQRSAHGRTQVVGELLLEHANLCASEPFAEQSVAARCSGVLVDERLVLTAGHCALSIVPCAEQVWVFGYALTAPDEAPLLTDDDVYRCVSVPVSRRTTGPKGQRWDYAWVELDRPVPPPRQPAPLGADPVAVGDPVTVIGYPNGLPVKVDRGAEILAVRPDWLDYFSLSSDTFDGSSGSGVFDQSGQLAGVFVRGGHDYEYREDPGCFLSRRIDEPHDPDGAEQASYWRPAVTELCATGWPSQTLCPAREQPGPHAPVSACSLRSRERAPGEWLIPWLVCLGLLGARRSRCLPSSAARAAAASQYGLDRRRAVVETGEGFAASSREPGLPVPRRCSRAQPPKI